MQLDLLYLPHEDRMRLSLRGKVDWLITRSLLLRLVAVWIEQLQKIDLPNAGIALGQRDVRQEHARSLEFDGPQASSKALSASAQTQLLQEIDLTVDVNKSKPGASDTTSLATPFRLLLQVAQFPQ